MPSDRVTARAKDVGADWQPTAYPVEFFARAAKHRVPVRATITSFGPTLLAKVLGLNDVQESSLGLVFHYATRTPCAARPRRPARGHPAPHLAGRRRGADALGGLSKATAGVILRELIAFADAGAEDFFGETEFDTRDFCAPTDGRGVVSMLELPSLQDKRSCSPPSSCGSSPTVRRSARGR